MQSLLIKIRDFIYMDSVSSLKKGLSDRKWRKGRKTDLVKIEHRSAPTTAEGGGVPA